MVVKHKYELKDWMNTDYCAYRSSDSLLMRVSLFKTEGLYNNSWVILEKKTEFSTIRFYEILLQGKRLVLLSKNTGKA